MTAPADRVEPRRGGAATRHFLTLDAMRGFAAIAVVCYHAKALFGPYAPLHGYLAVDFFFGLSGLVLARAYGGRFDAGMGVWRFLKLRVVRLYPLYILGTTIGLAAILGGSVFGARVMMPPAALAASIASALLMLPSPVLVHDKAFLTPYNVPGWSLLFELGINIVLAAVWRWLTAPVLAAIILLSGAILLAETFAHGSVDFGDILPTAIRGIARVTFSFFVGVALARCRVSAWRGWFAWLLPIPLLLSLWSWPVTGPAYDAACVFLLYPALIYVGAQIEPVGSGAARLLGLVSFSIYALHAPLLGLLDRVFVHAPALVVRPWTGILVVAGLFVAAWLADVAFDRPVRAWLGRKWHLQKTAAA